MKNESGKTAIMAFRVTPKMRRRITEAATAEGMTVPDWMRYVLAREAKSIVKELV